MLCGVVFVFAIYCHGYTRALPLVCVPTSCCEAFGGEAARHAKKCPSKRRGPTRRDETKRNEGRRAGAGATRHQRRLRSHASLTCAHAARPRPTLASGSESQHVSGPLSKTALGSLSATQTPLHTPKNQEDLRTRACMKQECLQGHHACLHL